MIDVSIRNSDFAEKPLHQFKVTAVFSVAMALIFWLNPKITETTYLVLSPWMHDGLDHIGQNLLVFTILGAWLENRINSWHYLAGVIAIGYLSLYLPIALEYGGLSRGVSGVNKAFLGYFLLVQYGHILDWMKSVRRDDLRLRAIAIHSVLFTVALGFVIVTIARFTQYIAPPDGVSVSSHLTGLFIGFVWNIWKEDVL